MNKSILISVLLLIVFILIIGLSLYKKHRKKIALNERINQLKETAMIYYTNQGDLKRASDLFEGKTFKKKNEVTREAFYQAHKLDPYDLDLIYSLASSAILKRDVPKALEYYEEMLSIDNSNFDAQLMKTIFSKVNRDMKAYKESFKRLLEIDSDKAVEYGDKINHVDSLKKLTFTTSSPEDLPEERHGFVVLGYALSDQGKIKAPLLKRLKTTLEAAKAYPNSKIIVTGGVPKNGVTESDAMYDWLVDQGVNEARILKENTSTDTIDNALYTMDLVEDEGLDHITLLTGAKHMRRALALFYEADRTNQSKHSEERIISHIAHYDYKANEDDTMSKAEEIVIYRDLVRTSGIWLFPKLYR